ncbi:MAG: SIS domain-containing protein [Methylococcaceae bacterium]|nr:SIS domain-containing protein [Methylococcaceae bacterium]
MNETDAKNADIDENLKALYPFLHNKKQDPVSANTALLNSVKRKIEDHQSIIESFFTKNAQAVVEVSKAIAGMYRNNGRLYTMGNGGSSSDASHIAVEFLHPVTAGRPALSAFDLSMDKTMITAVANDVGYANVFLRQVIAYMRGGDILLGVSTSGNSENLVKAFSQAKKMQAITIGLSGGNGGEMAKMGLDHCLIVECDSIHRTQECHVAIYHVVWDLVHTLLADDRGNLHRN